jgi:hypothetical protein
MADQAARRSRRVTRPGAPGADPTPQDDAARTDPTRAKDDTDEAWGDRGNSNDEQLKRDVPPHW